MNETVLKSLIGHNSNRAKCLDIRIFADLFVNPANPSYWLKGGGFPVIEEGIPPPSPLCVEREPGQLIPKCILIRMFLAPLAMNENRTSRTVCGGWGCGNG